MNKTTRSSVFTYALVVGAFVILQLLRMTTGLGSVLEGQLIPICAYVTMALALNLVVGVSGELSLGHAGFMSIGAFLGCAAANGLAELIPFTPVRLGVAMVIGAALAGFFGFLIGIPVLRLNGDYLAIVTLAFGEIIKSIITNVYLGVDENGLQFSFLSNKNELADGGVELIRGPMGVMNTQRISTFIAGFVLVLVALVVIFNLVNSRTGRAVMAARDNRIAAESVGISVTKYKMIAFVVSAALAGAAGTLYGCSQTTFAATKFDFNPSILILVFVVLGGLGNMWGSVIAAAALTILPEALRQFSNYRMLVYAIVLILVMQTFFLPGIDLEALRNAGNLAGGLPDIAGTGNLSAEKMQIIQKVAMTIDPIFIIKFLASFLFYFIGGYLLYASLFAAIGAAVDNETDSQQFLTPLSIILVIGLYIGFAAMKSPESPMVFWSSLIPFTSPIVMLVRIPFGVPTWEILTSMALLIVSFIFFTWLSGKIYRIGILMYGKKVTWKELYKWLKY